MQHLSKQISLHLVHRRRLCLRSGHERQQPLEIFPQLGYHLGGVESHGVSPEKNVLFKPIIPDCRLSFNSFFSLVMLPTDFSHTLIISSLRDCNSCRTANCPTAELLTFDQIIRVLSQEYHPK